MKECDHVLEFNGETRQMKCEKCGELLGIISLAAQHGADTLTPSKYRDLNKLYLHFQKYLNLDKR